MMRNKKSKLVAAFASAFLVLAPAFFASSTCAQPSIVYGPYADTPAAQVGNGLACISRFSSLSSASDFLIGAPGQGTGGTVRILSGANGTTELFSDSTIASGAQLGFAVAPLGDVDGDGLGDAIYGLPGLNTAFETRWDIVDGSAYIVPMVPQGVPGGAALGYSVAGLFTKVGASPQEALIVGAPFSPTFIDPETRLDGAVYIFEALSGGQLWQCPGRFFSNELFGTSVSGFTDLTGDGTKEFLVGAPGYNNGDGRVAVIESDTTSCVEAYNVIGTSGAGIGSSVASLPDVNGDSVADFITGGPHYDAGNAFSPGEALLVSGKTGEILCQIVGENDGDQFGKSVAGIADYDGNGTADFAIGAPGANGHLGAVHIFGYDSEQKFCYLITTIANADVKFTNFGGSLAGTVLGAPICQLKDDGIQDLLVGAVSPDNAQNTGAYAYALVPTPTPTPTPSPIQSPSTTPTPSSSPTASPSASPSPSPTRPPIPAPTSTPFIQSSPTASPSPVPTIKKRNVPPLPSSAQFHYSIYPGGAFIGFATLDSDPAGRCSATLLARHSNYFRANVGNVITVEQMRSVKKKTVFLGRGLNQVEMDNSCGKPFIMHMIVKFTCGKKVILSNVQSRYLTCGAQPSVSLNDFEKQLTRKIR